MEVDYAGDILPPYESAIVLVNHQMFIDWWMVMTLAARKGSLGCCKFFAKKSIQFIPGVGTALTFLDSVFLSRSNFDLVLAILILEEI